MSLFKAFSFFMRLQRFILFFFYIFIWIFKYKWCLIQSEKCQLFNLIVLSVLCSILLTENLKSKTVLRLPDFPQRFNMERLFLEHFYLKILTVICSNNEWNSVRIEILQIKLISLSVAFHIKVLKKRIYQNLLSNWLLFLIL